jgi:peptidoglycan hydrolase-like protein with peptidoglycan-binding domain
MRYQRAHKLKADGVVEAYTWESLVVTLRRGSRGNAVRAAQVLLNWQFSGWNGPDEKKPKPIPVDGEYGKITEEAVKFFQRKAILNYMLDEAPNGVVAKLEWCYLSGGRLDGE